MKTIHSNNESEHLRDQAIINLEQGALTPGYSANVAEVIYYLNESLATELVSGLVKRSELAKGSTVQQPVEPGCPLDQ